MPPINRYRSTQTKVVLGAPMRKELNKIVARQIKAKGDKKNFTSTSSTTVLASNAYLKNLLANIAQGTGVANRVGSRIFLDEIHITLRLDGSIANLSDHSYTLGLYWSDEETTSSANFSTISSGSVTTNLPWLSQNTSFNEVGQWDPDQTTLSTAKDWRIQILQNGSTLTPSKMINIKMKYKGKAQTYLSDTTGSYMEGKNLYFFIIGNVPGSTPGTTTVGAAVMTHTVYFRN